MSSESDAPSFVPPPFREWPKDVEVKTYKGRCHCGKITFEFDHPLLEQSRVVSCNCSWCSRTGGLTMFVLHSEFFFLRNHASLTITNIDRITVDMVLPPHCVIPVQMVSSRRVFSTRLVFTIVFAPGAVVWCIGPDWDVPAPMRGCLMEWISTS